MREMEKEKRERIKEEKRKRRNYREAKKGEKEDGGRPDAVEGCRMEKRKRKVKKDLEMESRRMLEMVCDVEKRDEEGRKEIG